MWLLNYSRSPCAAEDWLHGRHPPTPVPKRPHLGLFGRQRCSKSAGRCRLHIQQIQWSRPTCVTVIFVFIFLSCCLKRVEGHMGLLLFAKQRQQNSCVRSFLWNSCFCWSSPPNAKVNRLLETVIVFSLFICCLKFLLFQVLSMLYEGKYYPQISHLFYFFSSLISVTFLYGRPAHSSSMLAATRTNCMCTCVSSEKTWNMLSTDNNLPRFFLSLWWPSASTRSGWSLSIRRRSLDCLIYFSEVPLWPEDLMGAISGLETWTHFLM